MSNKELLDEFILLIPIYTSNVVPLLTRKLSIFNYPVDLNLRIGDNFIFGPHKTWRGIILGTVIGTLAGFALGHNFIMSFILAFGSLLGDLLGSFIKRRLNIKSGDESPLLDQIPFVAIPLILLIIFQQRDINALTIIILVVFSMIMHRLANFLGNKVGIKDVPW